MSFVDKGRVSWRNKVFILIKNGIFKGLGFFVILNYQINTTQKY